MKTTYEMFGVECGDGWKKLIEPLIEMCNENDVEIAQIKEKFGGLRFYVASAPEWIYSIIDIVEAYSFTVCETCGKKGEQRTIKGWYRTLCNECKSKLL